ncbi:MAG: hypothetical protein Q4F31_01665 [Eubacteriales bacterium]|nr:hypothetical protein [Eubacteriales bacterium]
MKKFLVLFEVLLLTFSLSFGAFAEENAGGENLDYSAGLREITGTGTLEPQEVQMAVNFDINESYTVTIPASIKLNGSFSSGLSGSAPIGVSSELSSGRSVIVSLKTQTLNPIYYVNGVQQQNFNNNTEFSKVGFTTAIYKDGSTTGNTASVEITGNNPLKANMSNADNGVKVVSVSGMASASNVLNYSLSGLNGLPSGSYSFLQTFDITVG